MHVRVQPTDHGGCGMYRLRWPAQVLADMGLPVTCHELDDWPVAHWRSQHGIPDRIVGVDADFDVLVLQRPMDANVVSSIPLYQRQGVAVVVEVDDDFTCLPKGHPSRRGSAGMTNPGYNRRHLRRACEMADLVTCTTPALAARYAPHGRVAIVPNCVPARYLTLERPEHPEVRVGWTGATTTHIDDLRVVGDGVARALDGRPFHVVGTGFNVAGQLGIDEHRIVPTGWVEIDDYPAAYADLDVAIVPLADNDFNRAKSWLKGIEAAALGVAFVASPTDPYCGLAALGGGGLARTPDEWRIMLRLLIENSDVRTEIAVRGRDLASHWTVEGNAWRWAEAWERALLNRREKKAA